LWVSEDSPRLSRSARKLIADSENELLCSVVSIWEITIKQVKGLAGFDAEPHLIRNSVLENGYNELEITAQHVLAVSALPLIHKDPFDRLLIAQAVVEGIILLTADTTIAHYPGPIRKV
jgi:PIN domain nuclease of toxin-antitoxin system